MRPSRPSRSTRTARSPTSPRTARAKHRAHRRGEAAVAGRRLLARRREPSDAHARVRDRSSSSRTTSTSTASSRRARDHRLGRSSGSSASPRSRRARPSGCRPAPPSSTSSCASAARCARPTATTRSRRPSSTTPSCGRPRATGSSTATTCSSRGRGPAVRLKPMNCPGPLPPVRDEVVLPRPARALPEPGLLHRNELSGCTASCACATSSRTTPTSSARPSRRSTRPRPASTWPSRPTTSSASSRTSSCPRARRAHRRGRAVGRGRGAAGPRPGGEGLSHEVREGDGAFYGPKIDLHFRDSLGRSWQLGRCSWTSSCPSASTSPTRARTTPSTAWSCCTGRCSAPTSASSGSCWRTPRRAAAWLAPVQAIVLPIADRHAGAAGEGGAGAARAGVRAEVDDRTESVGRKIRDAELRKVPYMLVVGDREAGRGRRAPPRCRGRGHRAWPTSSRGWPPRSRRAAERRGARRLARAPGGAARHELPGGLTIHEAGARRSPPGPGGPGRPRRCPRPADGAAARCTPSACASHGSRLAGRDGAVVRVDRCRPAPPVCRRAAVVETKVANPVGSWRRGWAILRAVDPAFRHAPAPLTRRHLS